MGVRTNSGRQKPDAGWFAGSFKDSMEQQEVIICKSGEKILADYKDRRAGGANEAAQAWGYPRGPIS